MEIDLCYFKFVVDETPYCLWTPESLQYNQRFLESIDPLYFSHIREAHEPMLKDEGVIKHYAAVALRTAYAQGLETLFALLGSAIQAPHCTVGWILKYQNHELRSLTKKIQDKQPIYAIPEISIVSWETVTKRIMSHAKSSEREDFLVTQFSNLWQRFASDFLKDENQAEYNSIKHGLRISMGGFEAAIGKENEFGIPSIPDEMISLGKSVFGTSFFETDRLLDKQNFQVLQHSLNWNPVNHLYGLELIACSIQNILAFLKAENGIESKDLKYTFATDEEFYKKPWQDLPGIISFNIGPKIAPDSIKPVSKDEILAIYKK
jgi:hypothetical protein